MKSSFKVKLKYAQLDLKYIGTGRGYYLPLRGTRRGAPSSVFYSVQDEALLTTT
jgi:hypothetical protein